ncbi:MAG TPA: DNA-binding transcriptional regulator [Phycisphaerae bacterium]|nr:DNA-binding transcriptional regulator [Phycisphaerae bacterium]
MRRERQIGVLILPSFHYGREVLRGIADFGRTCPGWRFTTDPWRISSSSLLSRLGPCDGIIAIESKGDMPPLPLRAQVPWVAIADVHRGPGPRVMPDNEEVGRLAAEHLLSCGVRHFAYCGYRGLWYSDKRCAGFCRAIEAAHFEVNIYPSVFQDDREENYRVEMSHIEQWLATLPRPAAIFAANDVRAASVIHLCTRIGYRVPQDFAIVGVDNDELICDFSNPPLSSVDLNARRIGYEGAALLRRLIEGEKGIPDEPIVVAPRGVVKRQSSFMFAAEDPMIAAAFQYLREHACDGVRVADVLRAVPVARRTLEKASRRLLGRSLLEEIRRLRLERAKELLATTGMSISEVAAASGFTSQKQLAELFRKELDTCPTAYRRRARNPVR